MVGKRLVSVFNMVMQALNSVEDKDKPCVVAYYTNTGKYRITFEKISEKEPSTIFIDESSNTDEKIITKLTTKKE